jgi:hypothetical protein
MQSRRHVCAGSPAGAIVGDDPEWVRMYRVECEAEERREQLPAGAMRIGALG